MAFYSMRAFADLLEAKGELVRIKEPVRTELEITALADREMKSPGGGRALLIEQPVLPSAQDVHLSGADQRLWLKAAHGARAGGR